MKIEGKTAIITGGASGLGEACVHRLAGAGAQVVVLDLNEERGHALAAQIGDQAAFVKTDICSSEDIAKSLDYTIDRFGRLDIVINCAGISSGMKTASRKGPHDLDYFRKVIDINLVGVFDVMRQAAFRMLSNDLNDEDGRGVMINTSSIAAFDGQIGQVAYTASKAALVGMTLPVARDLAAEGIRICTIAPGLFNTPMMAALPEQVRVDLARNVPFPSKLGDPDEFAMLAQQIIENPMLNGETIRLDGAIRMSPK
ncbi:MAG TPA: 3-hydroxyacyl-CoA dehydrogenase [Syntrophomonadaceae bacterium]|jgi:NAD(P)-dependent dehydrogenase (short-subunit alcohol dehydrogenase family)|nr:3-hydroxyacyl-CoA dehydrogenase [Syntrophomonadaceae bacterium]